MILRFPTCFKKSFKIPKVFHSILLWWYRFWYLWRFRCFFCRVTSIIYDIKSCHGCRFRKVINCLGIIVLKGFKNLQLRHKATPESIGIEFEEAEQVVTYHDPCRLGRLAGIYDAPRELLNAIPGIELREMERSRENGVCCGTTGWTNCSSCSKEIQMQRLAEAGNTGAGTVITACPKCQIHFRCTKSAFDLEIEVTDLYDLLADRIKG